MNVAGVGRLPRRVLDATTPPFQTLWYRTFAAARWTYPAHGRQHAYDYTKRVSSRFSPGSGQFEALYLSESERVARLEGRELFGDAGLPGGAFQHPTRRLLMATVELHLHAVIDLTDPSVQQLLETTAQELTGDWLGYQRRTRQATVPGPIGTAPTQELGGALFAAGEVEAFLYISAQKPDACNLVIFPERLEQLQLGSWLRMTNLATGQTHELP